MRLHGIQERLRRHAGVDQQGNIADDRREPGGQFGRRQRYVGERARFELEKDRRLRQFVLVLPPRMQLAQPARRRTIEDDSGRAARMQRRVRRRLEPRRARYKE